MIPEPVVALLALYVGFLVCAARGLRRVQLTSLHSRGWIRGESERFVQGMSVVVLAVAVFLLAACAWRYHARLVDLSLLGLAFGAVSRELYRFRSLPREPNAESGGVEAADGLRRRRSDASR